MAVRASGCQRRDRKIYFRNQRNGGQRERGILDSLGTMLAGLGIGGLIQGGMQRLNNMVNPQNNGNPNYNPNANQNHFNPNNQNEIRNHSPMNRNIPPQNNLRSSQSMDPNQAQNALR